MVLIKYISIRFVTITNILLNQNRYMTFNYLKSFFLFFNDNCNIVNLFTALILKLIVKCCLGMKHGMEGDSLFVFHGLLLYCRRHSLSAPREKWLMGAAMSYCTCRHGSGLQTAASGNHFAQNKGWTLRTPLSLVNVARCQISLFSIQTGSGLPQCV